MLKKILHQIPVRLQQNNVETTINEKLVRVYKFDLDNIIIQHYKKQLCTFISLYFRRSKRIKQKIKTGEYAFFNPNTNISIKQ